MNLHHLSTVSRKMIREYLFFKQIVKLLSQHFNSSFTLFMVLWKKKTTSLIIVTVIDFCHHCQGDFYNHTLCW